MSKVRTSSFDDSKSAQIVSRPKRSTVRFCPLSPRGFREAGARIFGGRMDHRLQYFSKLHDSVGFRLDEDHQCDNDELAFVQ